MVERTQEGTALSAQQLLSAQVEEHDHFFGGEVLPEPLQDLLEFIERKNELGFTFEPYLEPNVTFTPDANYPGWLIKPNSWFWEQIRRGNLSPEAARLSSGWAAMETIQKPNYDEGRQLYENDALAPMLESLREEGKIQVPDWCRHIPSTSRFGVSPLEIDRFVAPGFAQLANIKPEQVQLPPYMVWNYRGNVAHPEWGETNTLEWFANNFADARRLIGGDSDYGGLGDVHYAWSDRHSGRIGFRLLVRFPSKP